MMEHPDELLAEYVDGSLAADDRARVDAHLASCSVCTEEVAMAAEARTALTALPEVPAPFGIEQRILRGTQREARWASPFAWKAARVAVVAAAVVGIGTAIFLGVTRQADERSTLVSTESPEGAAQEEVGAPALAPAEDAAERNLLAGTVLYTESDTKYTTATLTSVVRRFAADAESALAEGFPATARDYYAQFNLTALEEPAQKALECVNTGVPPDRTVVPFVIEAASFETRPAYLVAYLRGPDADSPYDRVQVVVVDRESCGVLHFARQNL